jgi:hypothetical protein
MATDILGYQQQLSEAERAAQPHVMHLRCLHTDPAVAKEFLQLRDENKRLQDEKLKLRSTVEGLQFKVGDQVCAASFFFRGVTACDSRLHVVARPPAGKSFPGLMAQQSVVSRLVACLPCMIGPPTCRTTWHGGQLIQSSVPDSPDKANFWVPTQWRHPLSRELFLLGVHVPTWLGLSRPLQVSLV